MHEWFSQPIATQRMAAHQQRAAARRLRIAGGHDLASWFATAAITLGDRSAARLRRRAAAAASGGASGSAADRAAGADAYRAAAAATARVAHA